MNRSDARTVTLQSLYQIEISGLSIDEAINNITADGDKTYVYHLVNGVIQNLDAIDTMIQPHLKGWNFGRLSHIDRAILRIGAYELLFESGLPGPVAINEAVELAKKFGDEKSKKFINGVLSSIYKDNNNKP